MIMKEIQYRHHHGWSHFQILKNHFAINKIVTEAFDEHFKSCSFFINERQTLSQINYYANCDG